MIAVRWLKVARDVRAARGRLVLLGIAMTLSILAATALLVAGDILDRELSRSFIDTRPASAILHMDRVDDATVAAVRTRPGIAAAEAAAVMSAKIRTSGGEWLLLQLVVVPDFDAMSIDTFAHESGQWPPPASTLAIERSGIALLGMRESQRAEIDVEGTRHTTEIAGLVHDETRPPSTQEMMIYGYVTPATMRSFDASRQLDRLKVIVARANPTHTEIEAIARPLAARLREQGHRVHLIEIPPPGEHPHQWQYETISDVLLGFSILALVLESLLLAIVTAGVLAPQIREIAVMKTIGARSAQIASMYLSLVGGIALAALVIGLPLGIVAGRRITDFVASIVNVGIASYAIAPEILALCVALGVAMPLAAALAPTLAASRRTIRESLDDHGTTSSAHMRRGLMHSNTSHPLIVLSIRNTLRQRRRFALAVVLLTMAGLVFIVAGNLLRSWQNVSASADAQRAYDIQMYLQDPIERQRLLEVVRIAGVARAEPFDSMPAYVDRGDALAVTGAGRNGFGLRFVPANTTTMRPTVIEGRWLDARDTNALVINTTARGGVFPNVAVGDFVGLLVNSRSVRMQVVGIVKEPLSGGAGYATSNTLDALVDAPGRSRSIRVAVAPGYSREAVSKQIESLLEQSGADVTYVGSRATMKRAEEEHVYVVIALLGLIVVAIAIVGSGGLASALSTSVIQRTREIGIMRAIGARSRHVYMSVLAEAVLIGATSWLLGLLLSIPATVAVVGTIRRLTFQSLTMQWSASATIAWLGIALVVAAAASCLPARRAVRFKVAAAVIRN